MKFIDIKGKFFGMIFVIEKSEEKKTSNGEVHWKCQCCCERGTIFEASGSRIRHGYIKHCGCLKDSTTKEYWEKLRNRLEQRCAINCDCKEWVGYKNKNGHGMITIPGNISLPCESVSWMIHKGPIPKNMTVGQNCGNIACFNIDHLFLRESKKGIGNFTKGSERKHSKLTEEDVIYILSVKYKFTSNVLSNRFNVRPETIRAIWQRKNWKHVEIPYS